MPDPMSGNRDLPGGSRDLPMNQPVAPPTAETPNDMDDHQLMQTLRSVGMEVFETFYDQFADWSLTNQQVAALLKEQRGYAERATQSRVSGARTIIRAGRGPDALRLCARRTR